MSYYRHGPQRPSGMGIGVPGLTPLVKKLVIANVAIWLVQALLYSGAGIDLSRWLGVVPNSVIHGFLWQPLTYMFLHNPTDPIHLLFNMLMLWMFGGELERFWGPAGFLRFYLVAGTGGGICATLLGIAFGGSHALVPTIGASGAIFGLFVAFGIVFARRTVLFMFFFPMQARTMALILVGLAFFYLLSQPGSNVSHIAHLGGALTGYLYLKRAWRIGEFWRELRWKIRRRKFKVTSSKGPDEWIH
jgi:membrane associated rhomboid family serine protease